MENKNAPQAEDELTKATNIAKAVQASGIEIKESYIEPKADDDALIAYARECGKWVENYKDIYGKQAHASGVESEVYLSQNGIDVIKINSGCYHKTWLEFFTRIKTHNRYFPDTAYTIEGYTKREDRLAIILKQPKIDIVRSATIEEVKDDLEKQGFIFKSIYEVLDEENGTVLRDFHAENAVIDKYGDVVYIDPLIQFKENSKLPPSLSGYINIKD